MWTRRSFLATAGFGTLSLARLSNGQAQSARPTRDIISHIGPDEDLFGFLIRTGGTVDPVRFAQLLGAANEFKEGDDTLGLSAADEMTRHHARTLLSRTRIGQLEAHSLLDDEVFQFNNSIIDPVARRETPHWTFGQLKQFLLTRDEAAIQRVMPGLSSEVIGCVVKLLSNDELIAIGRKVFNPLPGSQIGARGYLGARIQPNSPTDNVDDIRWQVLDGWAYAVGDVLLGTNPVSSDPQSVLAVERTLQDLLTTFGLDQVLPHCVLAHIDVQAEVEQLAPGSTALWFQSIAGVETANATFDISVAKMRKYAAQRSGKFGLYFETGQGADFTNGHGHGFDMVLHESRKYGFARALKHDVALVQNESAPWVHLNDVAGFIGPEVFRTREQLVRCCLEDIVMGKLHGLCLGLDVCSTLHMDVSLDDLDWCLNQILPASPAYLMALPTKIDPMLGYLTTGYQDHVRLREKFGYKVNDAMSRFFQELGVTDAAGRPTPYFGDPLHVFVQYRRRKGDTRPEPEIRVEGEQQLRQVHQRGVLIATGFGNTPGDLRPELQRDITRLYNDAKASLWSALPPAFVNRIPDRVAITTRSIDRTDYILHPESGERLSAASQAVVEKLRGEYRGEFDTQIVISDGLNALSISDDGHLLPFLTRLRSALTATGFAPAPKNLIVTSGRVRAGYRIGETLFGGLPGRRALLHIIGERPGTGHHTFSIYITTPSGEIWGRAGVVDHNRTRVVSGVARTAYLPEQAAEEVVRILQQMGNLP